MPEQNALRFAGLLRQLRAEARLTQEELAEAAGLSPRSVSDLERGINRTARKDTAVLLAGALGLPETVVPSFVAAARGRAPAEEVLAALRGKAPAWSECPYLGLVPFGEQDARVFYGRGELADQLVQRLAERLDRTGILLVAGESGVGKSSLLQAGLLPRLAAGALGPGSERWPRRVIRPAGRPLAELAAQLADLAGAPRLVLVVDQLEELFTGGANQQEQDAFLVALHAAATGRPGRPGLPRALVVAAMRADFLGRVIAYPPWRAVLDAGLFTVGPMSEADLRLAITGPAAEAELTVEPALVDEVIAELRLGGADLSGAGLGKAGLGSGALPLMSQAMAATWERREGRELTLRGYRRAGGVADAVNHGAQAAFDRLTSRQREAARLVFTQLTVVMPDGRFVRRRCSRAGLRFGDAQLAADADAVIDVFSAQRLLVLGHDSVEISHDVLLLAWTQLRDWLGDDQLDRALYGQVVTDAQTWDGSGRDSAYLYRPGRLAAIDAATARWQDAPTRYPPLPDTSRAFLRAAHHAGRRSARRRQGVIAGLLALTVFAVSAAGIAVHAAADASRQHAIALSIQLATEGLIVASGDPLTARRLAVAAWRVSPTDQASSVMTNLLAEQQRSGMLPGDPATGGATAVAFSRHGQLLASGYGDGTVRLWNPVTEQAVGAPLHAGTGSVTGVAFSPGGTLLATGDADGTVQLWNPATGRAAGPALQASAGAASAVSALAFSPGGTLLAAGDADGTVQLWSPATRQALPGVSAGGGPVNGLAFSPGGKLLATADADGTVDAWNPVAGQIPVAAFGGHGPVNGVAFSPGGTLLAAADADGTVRMWNPATGRAAGAPLGSGLGPPVTAVAFSPGGSLLAAADANGTVQRWNPATRRAVGAPLPAESGPGRSVTAVAFSPGGSLLAAADANGTVRLWNPATGYAPYAPLPASTGTLYGVGEVAFTPNGTLLASADADGTVRMWNPATGRADGPSIRADTQPASTVRDVLVKPGVTGVAISPRGTLLASADADGIVRLWNMATRKADGPSLPASTGPGTGVKAVAFSPDGTLLATADADGTIRLWNMATRRAIRPALPGDSYGFTAVAFSHDGKQLATGDADGTIRLWNMATRKATGLPLRPEGGPGIAVTGLAFSPDGQRLASSYGDGTVRLWNPATGQADGTRLTADPGQGVNGVAFSPDGKLLATADADGNVRLWNPATGQAIGAPLPSDPGYGVNGVAFSPDGTLLATADADGTVQTWQVALFTAPYAALCADVGSPTPADWAQYAPGVPQVSVCG